LTEKTITENRQMQQEKVELATAKLQVPLTPAAPSPTSRSALNGLAGTENAVQKTRKSAYFEEYASSSQYG